VIPDVLVVGGGPAGRALAAETGRRGLSTVLLDPAPDRPWRHTYGSWAAELPPELPPAAVAARARGRVIARTEHRLGWEYAVLDVAALRAHLDAGLAAAGVDVRAGRVLGRCGSDQVSLADGRPMRARLVVDAGGAGQPLGRPNRTAPAEQAAYGLIVEAGRAAGLLPAGEALFMDWRPDHGETGPPTFLYAVPLGHGAVLLEETSLARRPGLPMPVLRRRLLSRLARHGVDPAGSTDERVLFRLDTPHHRADGVLGFGAAAPLVHPASGFSLATSLTLAPRVAHALATGLLRGTDAALAAAEAVLWPPAARAVHRFRRIGLEALLRMPSARVPDFFEMFFGIPERYRWAYLTDRADLLGATAAMGALFRHADWAMRARLVLPALSRPAPPAGANPGRLGR
jgi:lycopene beta-cyclase